MIRFLDGPAASTTLTLARAPRLLRVVTGHDGVVDALDQWHDRPKLTETITVYERVGHATPVHVKRDRKAGGCCWLLMADYRLVTPAPPAAAVRDTREWRDWALAYDKKKQECLAS